MFKQYKHSKWMPGMKCASCGTVTNAQFCGYACRACGVTYSAESAVVKYRIVEPTLLRQVILLLRFQLPDFAAIQTRQAPWSKDA